MFVTYPFICDDLIGSVLRGIEWWQSAVDFTVAWVCYFGFEASTGCRAARVASWSDVIEVQVLLVGLILFLQGFIEDVWVIPDLDGEDDDDDDDDDTGLSNSDKMKKKKKKKLPNVNRGFSKK